MRDLRASRIERELREEDPEKVKCIFDSVGDETKVSYHLKHIIDIGPLSISPLYGMRPSSYYSGD